MQQLNKLWREINITDDKISIVLTERCRLSSIRVPLGSILINSHFQHHEIVFVGDRIWQDCMPRYEIKGFKTMEQYLEEYWIPKFEKAGFTFSLYKGNWSRENLDTIRPLPPCYECWSYGVEKAKNEWVMPFGGDDFLSPNWDVNITKRFPDYPYDKYVFQPVFSSFATPLDELPPNDGLRNDAHYIGLSKGWKHVYVSLGDDRAKPMLESMIYNHWSTHKQDAVYIESGGMRAELAYFSTVVHISVVDKMRRLNVNKQFYNWQRRPNAGESGAEGLPNACDLEFDDNLGVIGVQKVGCLDSFYYDCQNYRRSPLGKDHYLIFDRSGEP